MKTRIILSLAALLMAPGGCKKEQPQDKAQAKPDSASPAKAPDFTLTGFDGNTVSLADYKGKIVVLEWFSNKCPFVQYHYEKANTMTDLAEKYKDKGVVWLAIDSTSYATDQEIKDYAAAHNITYPILDDRPGKVGRAYGARTTPHMFIIDKDSNIAYNGGIDNAPLGNAENGLVNYVDKVLSELLAGQPVGTAKTEPYGCSVKYPS